MTYISDKNFYLEVAKGNVPKHSIVHKFGSGAVTTSILPVTFTNNYPTPTAAVALEVVSSNAADAQNGVGARTITFVGLDANWAEVTQVVSTHATDGTIAVSIPTSLIRMYRWYVSESGATWSQIPITPFAIGQSTIGVYTIPLGFTAYLLSKNVNVNSNKAADLYMFRRPLANDVTTPYTGTLRVIQMELGVIGGLNFDVHVPKLIGAGPCDIGFMAAVASGTGDVSVEFELLLIED